ncbi:MAG: beta-methylgalactoside transporter [Lawsonibacter sp.]|jgi:methyl-galactoside transport system permease protein|nr:beta-methylgalactoside transporter [Lawsonibacter sp.]MCI9027580.1 beta-methylgalactoside transporter [Lawsonibacter sp.]MCI9294000.1 beta-methylgalactoside transporter [Lawsonibacter sp.]MCI9654947.1 beta-methylgalactoside transporter [Lawsonibacter sp.]MDE6899028.1 beta-methylgalactoside transporter [Lawsonibacter sp.]
MEKKFDVKKFLSNNAIIILIILLALFTGVTTQNFFKMRNFSNLVINMAPRFIIACGVSGCLITKGTDLSAGRQVGLAACFSAMLLQSVDYAARMFPDLPDIPWPLALLGVVVVMGVFGAVNGCVIAFLKVPPFIATLGMQTIVYGMCSVITNNQPMGGYKQSYLDVASGKLGDFKAFGVQPFIAIPILKDIPYLLIFALLVGLFFWFLYNKTRHGKYMYAIGGNENAAQVAGVNVAATLIRIYILASIMYGLAGFLVGAKAGGASTATGFGYELEAIAACTIGGVSTNGGVGKVSGILVGVLVFETLKICLQFLGVDPAYTYIAQGLVIIIAVALDLRKYLAKK